MDRQLLRDGAAYVDRWLEHQRAQREIPGSVLAIQHDDEIVLSRGYGFANLEQQTPMTPRHIFRIASHSKTFTATAIMLLVERGQVRLDDRVASYVEWLDSPVTVRQLLNHVGGVIRDGRDAMFWQLGRPFPDLAELKGMVEGILEPNEQFKYSNVGYSLLGQVIERIAGKPYNDFVRTEIVDRVGLHDTGPETHPGIADRLVTAYSPRRPDLPRLSIADIPTGAMSAATGFYSTAEDLCRYARAHYLGNDELLSDASKREMQQPYWSVPPDDSSYGLGFAVQKIGNRTLIGHGGGFPGHSTTTLIDPQDRLVVVVLNNTMGLSGLAGPLAGSIVKILDYALASHSDSAPTVQPERYTGRFMSLWGATDIASFGRKLVALLPDEAEPTAHAVELEVIDDDTLRIGRQSGTGSPGETIRYERDSSGQIEQVWIGGSRCLPENAFAEYMQRIGTSVPAPLAGVASGVR